MTQQQVQAALNLLVCDKIAAMVLVPTWPKDNGAQVMVRLRAFIDTSNKKGEGMRDLEEMRRGSNMHDAHVAGGQPASPAAGLHGSQGSPQGAHSLPTPVLLPAAGLRHSHRIASHRLFLQACCR